MSARPAAVAGYAAGVLGLLYAALSLYWTVGGTMLIETVGGTVEDLALRGGGAAVALGLGATVLKLLAGALAFALVRSRGRVRWLLILSALAGFVLIVYGGVLVAVGALVLTGVVDPDTAVDRTALIWHVTLWDLWFLVWGILLAIATVGYRQRADLSTVDR
jgi:hypothetical protein